MYTLTITSESFSKLFGLKHKIENNRGMLLSYHTGMILGKTSFFKDGRRWLTVLSKGQLLLENSPVGILKNRCAPEGETAIVATITGAKESCKAVVARQGSDGTEIHFLKEGRRIATATSEGTHSGLLVSYDSAGDLWIALVLGWCAHEYIFLKAWEKKHYFESAPGPGSPK